MGAIEVATESPDMGCTRRCIRTDFASRGISRTTGNVSLVGKARGQDDRIEGTMKRTTFEGMFVTFLFGSSGYRIVSRKALGLWFREISILARCIAVPSNSVKHHFFLMPDVQLLRDTKTKQP
jgi:hypothetical protein